MVEYLVLCIILLLLVIASYFVFKKDILSPTLIYSIAMFSSVFCSMIGLLSWNNVSSLKFLTVVIILISVVSFGIGEFISRKIIKSKDSGFSPKDDVDVEWWKIISQMVFVSITIALLYLEVKRIAVLAGYQSGGLGVMIGKYRELSNLYTTVLLENGTGINFFVSQMRKVCEVICFINIYFLVINIFKGKCFTKKNIAYLGIVILCLLLSMLTGGRMQMLIYVVFTAFIILIMLASKYDFFQIVKKYYKRFIGAVIGVLLAFCLLLPLSGRKNDVDLISYISFYFGAPTPSLNYYLDNVTEPQYFGEETLRGVQTVLFKLGISNNIQPISKEWITYPVDEDSVLSSNIFTSGKRYYRDFGFLGVMVCQIIFGFVFTSLYLISVNRKNAILIIFLGMNFYMIIDQIRDDLFYSNFVHLNSVLYFAILFIGFSLLTNFDIKKFIFSLKRLVKKCVHQIR